MLLGIFRVPSQRLLPRVGIIVLQLSFFVLGLTLPDVPVRLVGRYGFLLVLPIRLHLPSVPRNRPADEFQDSCRNRPYRNVSPAPSLKVVTSCGTE